MVATQDLRIVAPARLGDGTIILDGYAMSDAEAHWRGEDEEMRRRFGSPDPAAPTSLDDTRQAVARFIKARAAGGPNVVFAVRDLAGELVGGCELRRPSSDCLHVSYWTLAPFRCRGVATRALRLLCAAAASMEEIVRIEAHVDPDNLASQGVARRAGFVPAGETEDTSWAGAVSTRLVLARQVRGPGGQPRPMA